jgi:hypothetical protein
MQRERTGLIVGRMYRWADSGSRIPIERRGYWAPFDLISATDVRSEGQHAEIPLHHATLQKTPYNFREPNRSPPCTVH